MSSAITGQSRPAPAPVPVEGAPECPFCKKKEHVKSEQITMSTIRAVFECVACGLFRLASPSEMDVWAKMKGRVVPPPPQSNAITMDPDLVAKSTNVVHQ